jgi:hypothetical protein
MRERCMLNSHSNLILFHHHFEKVLTLTLNRFMAASKVLGEETINGTNQTANVSQSEAHREPGTNGS